MNSKRLMRENITKLAIPKGELLPGLLQFLDEQNCTARPIEQSTLVYEFPYLALPLMLVAIRPRDIGKVVSNPASDVWFGLTGSDIVLEQGLQAIDQLPPRAMPQNGRLAFGFTPNLMEAEAKPTLQSLSRQPNATVVTPYPHLAQRALSERGITARVQEVLGSTEAMWWADANCLAVLDVIVSGKTFAQNNIVEADTVLDSVSIHVVADERNARTRQKTEQMERDREVIRELLTRLKK